MFSLLLSITSIISPAYEQPRVVYFDFGGVVAITDAEKNLNYLVDLLGLPKEAVQNSPHLRWMQLHPDEIAYLQAKAGEFQLELSEENLEGYRLAKRAAVTPVAGVEELISELRKNGYTVNLISNIRSENIDLLEPYKPLFDRVILTPKNAGAREVWEREACLNGLTCSKLILIDDQLANVEEANRYGVQTIEFQSGDLLRKALIEKGILPFN